MEERPNYYAIIPANVRYNENLNSSQKLFYGEITALTYKTGECWASNNYFARIYKVSPSLITNWVKALEKEKLITVDYEHKGKSIKRRTIRIIGIQNIEHPIQNIEEGYSKYLKENNTSINNTSINNDDNIIGFLQNNGFFLTPIQYDYVKEWEDTELTRYAIKRAVLNGKYNIAYIQAILNSYEKNNIKTVQQAMEQDQKFNKKDNKESKVPEWFDKDFSEEEIDDETRRLIEKIRGA